MLARSCSFLIISRTKTVENCVKKLQICQKSRRMSTQNSSPFLQVLAASVTGYWFSESLFCLVMYHFIKEFEWKSYMTVLFVLKNNSIKNWNCIYLKIFLIYCDKNCSRVLIETLTEALQKWMPRFLANSFFCLKFSFE